MKIFYILIIFLISLFNNSLVAQSQSENKNNLPDLPLINLKDSVLKYNSIDPSLCIQYCYKAIEKVKDKKSEEVSELYFTIGDQLNHSSDSDKLEEYSDKLLQLAEQQSFELLKAHAYYFKNAICYSHYKSIEATENLNKAIPIYDKFGSLHVIDCYLYLTDYLSMNDLSSKAYEYFRICIDKINTIPVSNKTKLKVYDYYASFLGNNKLKYNEGDVDSIYYYNNKAKELIRSGTPCKKYTLLMSHCNDAIYDIEKNNIKQAKEALDQASSVKLDGTDLYIYLSIVKAKYYLSPKVHDLVQAEYHCQEAIELNKKQPITEVLFLAYKYLAQIALERKEIDKGIKLFEASDSVNRNFFRRRNINRFAELDTYFNVYRLKYEKEKTNKELQSQKNTNIILSISIAFLIIFSFLLYYFFKQSKHFNTILKESNNTLSEQKRTLSKQAEELNLLNSKLVQSNLKLQNNLFLFEESNKKLEVFGQNLSHDLRSPVRIMTTFSKITLSKYNNVLDSKGKEYLNFIYENGVNLQRMITEILENALALNTLDTYKVHLNEVLNIVKNSLKEEINSVNANIVANPLPEIIGYNSEMVQLFMNLISNSIKYRRKDVPLKINIDSYQEGDYITLAFEDNGMGIRPEMKDSIFNLFQSTNHGNDSYGIGLNSCVKIIKDYGGNIKVESEWGNGSRFIATFRNKRFSLKAIPTMQ